MFLFGASTSSHQVEGKTRNDWDIWEHENATFLASSARKKYDSLPIWPFIKKNAVEPHNYIADKNSRHYTNFQKDFELANALGHNTHRFSIEWSRVEPIEGEFDIKALEHYKEVINTLKRNGLEPVVTLWHWVHPVWFARKGAWLAQSAPKDFAKFVDVVISYFGKDVKYWVTLNEPEIYTSNSYYRGIWPPQKKSLRLSFKVINNLIDGHKIAYKTIKAKFPHAMVGMSKNNTYFESAVGKIVSVPSAFLQSFFWNIWILKKISKFQDFIGLNYYFHNRLFWGRRVNLNKRINDLGWEIFPSGIYFVLKQLYKYFPDVPIIVTENGLADMRDKDRGWFIKEHLRFIRKAMNEGVDVRGYIHWSFIDNFEWDKGFWPRFGLVEIDYVTGERKPRSSAYIYKSLIKNWQ